MVEDVPISRARVGVHCYATNTKRKKVAKSGEKAIGAGDGQSVIVIALQFAIALLSLLNISGSASSFGRRLKIEDRSKLRSSLDESVRQMWVDCLHLKEHLGAYTALTCHGRGEQSKEAQQPVALNCRDREKGCRYRVEFTRFQPMRSSPR